MTRLLLCTCFLVAALPAGAQDVSPDTLLASVWVEALASARAAADAVDEVSEPAYPGDDADATVRRRVVVATGAAAGASAQVAAAVQFAVALAPAGEQEATEAALGELAVGLYESLLTVVVDARDLIETSPVDSAELAAWQRSAGFIGSVTDALADALTSLDR